MNETAIKRQICDYLAARQIFFWVEQAGKIPGHRTPRYARTGKADIIGVYNGRMLAIEVKTPKGVLSPEQVVFLRLVNESGGIGFMAKSISDVVIGLGEQVTDDEGTAQGCAL